jgi:hypothetical protein
MKVVRRRVHPGRHRRGSAGAGPAAPVRLRRACRPPHPAAAAPPCSIRPQPAGPWPAPAWSLRGEIIEPERQWKSPAEGNGPWRSMPLMPVAHRPAWCAGDAIATTSSPAAGCNANSESSAHRLARAGAGFGKQTSQSAEPLTKQITRGARGSRPAGSRVMSPCCSSLQRS